VRGLYDLTGIKGQNLQPALPLANTSVIQNILANKTFIQSVATFSARAGVQSIDMFLVGINYRFLGGPPKF
jgi:hypothetical protein